MRVEDVTGYIRQAEKVTFIIGAGASIAAGIPSAGGLIDRITRDYPHCLRGLSDADRRHYGKLMGALSPGDRKALIEPILTAARINWGQIALASILGAGKVQRILTFNFDLVLERAASLLGLQLPVYDFGVAPSRDVTQLAAPAIFHLHGQSYGLRLMNSDDETRTHAEALRPLLADSLRNHLTLVFGYSGEADAAFGVIEDEYNSHTNLIWLGHGKDPKPHLQGLLRKPYARYVGGCDFDRTMIDIARGLGCWPPEIVTNPPRHVLAQLADVAAFPVVEDGETDLLTSTRRRLEAAATAWGEDKDSGARAQKALIAGNPLPPAGNLAGMSDEEREARAWAEIMAGNALADEARKLEGAVREERFVRAGEKYGAALAIKPDMHEALFNWGNALDDEARRLEGAARTEKLAQAGEKFAAALAIKPDKHEALNNWGNALTAQAQTLGGVTRAAKFAEAGEKYAAALAIKPDDHEALYNWGSALDDEARTLEGAARAEKLAEAGEKYAAALAIKPDMHEALNNWGSALDDRAQMLDGAARAEKLAEAVEKFSAALAIKPDLHQALDSWAASLLSWSHDLDGPGRDAALSEAERLLHRYTEVTGKVSYNLACLHALRGDVEAAFAALKTCLQDGTLPDRAHLEADPDMEPLRGDARFARILARARAG